MEMNNFDFLIKMSLWWKGERGKDGHQEEEQEQELHVIHHPSTSTRLTISEIALKLPMLSSLIVDFTAGWILSISSIDQPGLGRLYEQLIHR